MVDALTQCVVDRCSDHCGGSRRSKHNAADVVSVSPNKTRNVRNRTLPWRHAKPAASHKQLLGYHTIP